MFMLTSEESFGRCLTLRRAESRGERITTHFAARARPPASSRRGRGFPAVLYSSPRAVRRGPGTAASGQVLSERERLR